MRAITQAFGGNRKSVCFDWLGSAAIECHFYALDFGLPARLDLHILRCVDDAPRGQTAQFDSRRQCGDFKVECLRSLRAGFIHRRDGDGIAAWWPCRCLEHEVQSIARNNMRHLGFNAQAGDGRLAFDDHAAGQPVGYDRVGRDAFDCEARRNGIDLERPVHRGGLPACIGGADAEYMFFVRQQRKGVKVKFIGRFAVGLHDFAIDDELDLGDFGLSASLDYDDFRIGDFLLGRRHKVVIQRRWQRSHFKFGAERADIAFHILDCDIQLMLARLQFNRLDCVARLSGDQLAIQGYLDAFDLLVGADFDGDLRVFGDWLDEEFVGQE